MISFGFPTGVTFVGSWPLQTKNQPKNSSKQNKKVARETRNKEIFEGRLVVGIGKPEDTC